VRLDWFSSEIEAETALLALENAKRRRGYFMEPQQLGLF
jgi:predicted DNA-binding WGR domain protein